MSDKRACPLCRWGVACDCNGNVLFECRYDPPVENADQEFAAFPCVEHGDWCRHFELASCFVIQPKVSAVLRMQWEMTRAIAEKGRSTGSDSRRITDMLDEDAIAGLLDQHDVYRLTRGIQVIQHDGGWLVMVPDGRCGKFLRVGRDGTTGVEAAKTFRSLAAALVVALSPVNRARWGL